MEGIIPFSTLDLDKLFMILDASCAFSKGGITASGEYEWTERSNGNGGLAMF